MLNYRIGLLIYLTELDASSNQFSDIIGEDLFFLPQITIINLADNQLTGTLPPSIGWGDVYGH